MKCFVSGEALNSHHFCFYVLNEVRKNDTDNINASYYVCFCIAPKLKSRYNLHHHCHIQSTEIACVGIFKIPYLPNLVQLPLYGSNSFSAHCSAYSEQIANFKHYLIRLFYNSKITYSYKEIWQRFYSFLLSLN